jgi:sugar fermentation stimulation protein A
MPCVLPFSPPLTAGRLVQRHKRFLADVVMATGEATTAHCPNPGAMLGLATPGSHVWLSHSDAPGRKLPWTLEIVEADGEPVGINTMHPNRVVHGALNQGLVPELAGYTTIKREAAVGASRMDFLLQGDGLPDCWVEVKNCHLKRNAGLLEFPDSVTGRGAKHLGELARLAQSGQRAVMLYLGQRTDCGRFGIAGDIDPAYAAAFAAARDAGVEMLCYTCRPTLEGMVWGQGLPVLCKPGI